MTAQSHTITAPTDSPEASLPAFPSQVWRGLFANYRAWVGDAEGSDAFDFAAFAAAVGIRLGRRVYFHYGRALFPNMYAVLYGPSNVGRKTTAARRAVDLVVRDDSDITLLTDIASAEGLLQCLGGPPETKPEPRRAIVALEEFLSLLNKSRRERSNRISAVVTGLYDCPPNLNLSTRQNPILANKPTLGIIACTTPEWLERGLGHEDIMSGFANRFAYVTGVLRPPNPLPDLPDEKLAQDILEGIRKAERHLPGHDRIQMSPAARNTWSEYYYAWITRSWESETVRNMIQRVPEHILKVALMYSALEQEMEINPSMLDAAIAYGEYEAACVSSLFARFRSEEDTKIEAKIEAILAQEGSINMSPLHQRLSGRITAARLRALVGGLVGVGKAKYLDAQQKVLGLPDYEG